MPNRTFLFPDYRKTNIHQHSEIAAVASYVPPRVVTNQDIIDANGLPVTDVAVRKTLGIERRRAAEEGLTDSDLLVEAARRCLQRADLHPDQLSKIIVTKFLGDRVLPMTASMVQRKLNCRVTMHAFDLEGGINTFLYAIDLATRYISTTAEREQHILVLSGGMNRLAVSETDPRLAFLFGDAAAAVLISASQEPHFLASYAYTNYRYFGAAGSRPLKMEDWVSNHIYERGDYKLLYDLYQMGNWKDSIDFYLQAAEVTQDKLLEASRLSIEDIDLALVTENNKKIRDLTLERLSIPQEKSLSVIHEYGNTMSAMLPMLLDEAFQEKRLTDGTTVMLISHGEGASGGGLIYRV